MSDPERYLRVVRSAMDALGQTLDEALEVVPEELQPQVRALWEEQFAQPIRLAQVLSERGGPRAWFAEWDPSRGYYWTRQRSYLIDQLGRGERDVESLDDATDKILSHLEDPRPQGPDAFRVQGLVLGYVQSGKTANFSALIAKAADLGYKIVIVLSGIHNTLRQQTQRRLERELGLLRGIGVGEAEAGRRWISLTTAELNGDFRPGTVNAAVLQGNEQVLIVAKKNASVLRRLGGWMGDRVPDHVPVLIIDDEADQASINTGGNRPPLEDFADLVAGDVEAANAEDEVNPSTINRLIRQLILAFRRVSYVAYTATPFANVLVNHEGIDREVMEDLYPRDFIVALPRPNGYVGAEALFGRDPLAGETDGGVGALDVIDIIPEWEVQDLIPPRGEVDTFQPGVPESLELAFLDFILAIAGRRQRLGEDQPASMLVHTHPRTIVQNEMAALICGHVSQLRQRWRYDREELRPALEQRWDTRFRPVARQLDSGNDFPFETIEEYIDDLFRDPLTVVTLNSTTDDVLDYEANPVIKAVIIGGNRLSRGLTLEGLLVSYYVRRAMYFDTLLQMGRWFGFRVGYVDLTRIWTTEQLASWFRDLALAEEELREEIARYERERLTPLDFGVKIRAHPAMLVTARNKMGGGREINQNYSGRLAQTINFPLHDRDWLESNLEVTREFLASLGSPHETSRSSPSWSDIGWREVLGFLGRYRTDPSAISFDGGPIRQYIRRQVDQEELVRWRVSVVALQAPNQQLGTEDLGIADFPEVSLIARTRMKAFESIGSLINPATTTGEPGTGDEELGLTPGQIMQAREMLANGEFSRYGDALRAQRDKEEGLLLVYPISRYSGPRPRSTRRPLFDDPDRAGCTVVGLAIVFPASASAATVVYVVGSVGDFEEAAQGVFGQ